MAKKEQRFIKVMEESAFISSNEVLVDTQTGVQYLYHAAGNSGGLTLLGDAAVPQDAGRAGVLTEKGAGNGHSCEGVSPVRRGDDAAAVRQLSDRGG